MGIYSYKKRFMNLWRISRNFTLISHKCGVIFIQVTIAGKHNMTKLIKKQLCFSQLYWTVTHRIWWKKCLSESSSFELWLLYHVTGHCSHFSLCSSFGMTKSDWLLTGRRRWVHNHCTAETFRFGEFACSPCAFLSSLWVFRPLPRPKTCLLG